MGLIKVKARLKPGGLKNQLKQFQELLRLNIITVVKGIVARRLIDLIMVQYDTLAERANQGEDDQTNPDNWRSQFLVHLELDVSDNITVVGNRIMIRLGDREFLGYASSGDVADVQPDDQETLHWMVFYLEGLLGEWAFITPELYRQLVPGGTYQSEWGRFGDGFMVSESKYEKQGWGKKIPFSTVRHPFSGFSPIDIFQEAVDEFNIRPMIQLAIKEAARGRKL